MLGRKYESTNALTVSQVRAELGVGQSTVEGLLARGELPSFTVGRCRRVLRRDLEAFIAERRTTVV